MRWARTALSVGIVGSLSVVALPAKEARSDDDLLARIEALERRIADQERTLASQQDELEVLRQRGRGLPAATTARWQPPSPPRLPGPRVQDDTPHQTARPVDQPRALSFAMPERERLPESQVAQTQEERISTEQPETGAQEEDRRPPEIQAIPELGGVLTPRGILQVEPSIEYTNSAVNRFTFRGIEVVEAVLLGVIEAEDADRDAIRGAATFRYGVTNRIELEALVPYVYRNDRITTLVDPEGTELPRSATDERDGMGLGDVEFAGHYQINEGRDGWPFFVGNLRVKANTGEGPFDVDRDATGVPTELATGSGFWGVEPSVTVIFPTDPAVMFANVGYTFNIAEDIDKTIGNAFFGNVDPGDTVGISFGLGLGLNERSSLTLGYQHDFIGRTTTEIDGMEFESNTLDVGSLLFGVSYRLSDSVRANLNARVGVTEDAPDVRLTFRLPISFQTPFM